MSNILSYWPDKSKQPRDPQIQALEWLEANRDKKYFILNAPVGCHTKGTKVVMFDGTLRNVEDVQPNDILMGPDSSPRRVLKLFNGYGKIYRIKPIKGKSFYVNEDHILSVITTPARRYGFDGKNIINISVHDYLNQSNDFKRNVKLYKPQSISFTTEGLELPIDPYLLGVLLGDGSITHSIDVTSMDPEIESYLNNIAEHFDCTIKKYKTQSKAHTYRFVSERINSIPRINHLINKLKNLQLYGLTSENKFIPHVYKISSIDSRLNILAGLIDTDGHNSSNCFVYTTKSSKLRDDVSFIAHSVGFTVTIYDRMVKGNIYYDVCISGHTHLIPTKIKRKQASIRQQQKRPHVTGFSVEYVNNDNFYGFLLDKDHLYMLDDFTVTHNSGKSDIGITFSRFLANGFGNSFILTPQRILQKQYENDFNNNPLTNLIGLYGKSNYECKSKRTNCAIGGLIKPKCNDCNHKNAKSKAATSSNMVLNYELALLQFSVVGDFERRQLMICDEAHSLENILCEYNAIHITKSRMEQVHLKWTYFSDKNKAYQWVRDTYLPALDQTVNTMEQTVTPLLEQKHLAPDEIDLIKEYTELCEHLTSVTSLESVSKHDLDKDWVLVHDKMNIKFKRLHADQIFSKYLGPYADKFLFMSATIPSFEGYCKKLGIPKEEAAYISLVSEFPPENRKVRFIPHMKMNVDWDKPQNTKSREHMLKGVKTICNLHQKDKGIIHTANFSIAEWLVENLKVDQQIFHHNPDSGDDRNSVIQAFIETPNPAILISPSITEGLDLKDDLARFGIIVKTPYPYLGDQWVKARMEESNEWYQEQAIIQVLQACGRIVRSKEDYGTTYILDESWNYLYTRMHSQIPSWWHKAYSVIR